MERLITNYNTLLEKRTIGKMLKFSLNEVNNTNLLVFLMCTYALRRPPPLVRFRTLLDYPPPPSFRAYVLFEWPLIQLLNNFQIDIICTVYTFGQCYLLKLYQPIVHFLQECLKAAASPEKYMFNWIFTINVLKQFINSWASHNCDSTTIKWHPHVKTAKERNSI